MLLLRGLVRREHRLDAQFLGGHGLGSANCSNHRKIVQQLITVPEANRDNWHNRRRCAYVGSLRPQSVRVLCLPIAIPFAHRRNKGTRLRPLSSTRRFAPYRALFSVSCADPFKESIEPLVY